MSGVEVSTEVLLGEESDEIEFNNEQNRNLDPDEYFARNAFRIVYQTNNFFLPQLRDLIERGEVLNIRPEYQRRLRWTSAQKSKLIESLLLNIPVPPIFLYESTAARYEVLDGQQRLNAVKEFLAGDFDLSGLTVLRPLNGIRYSRCPPRIKRALDRASMSAIVLLLEGEPDKAAGRLSLTDVRRFIFSQLNTGGTKLNPQELRNALHPGPLNDLLLKISRHDLFTTLFQIPPYKEADPNDYYENTERQKNSLYATMSDCQLVLRYFALKDPENIRGSMRSMLDRAMGRKISLDEASKLYDEYVDRLSFLSDLFNGKPFDLPPDNKGRVRISAAIYDAAMIAANELWSRRDEIRRNADGVRARMSAALGDPSQQSILTGAGNTAISVQKRIGLMRRVFSVS